MCLRNMGKTIETNKPNASVIRDKILAYSLRRAISKEAIEEHGEENINRRILAPLCIIDIAYGIYQEEIAKLPFKQECKVLRKRVFRLFNEGMFNRRGAIYGALTEDEICYLSDYSDRLSDAIKSDLDKLYYSLQAKTMDMPTEQRHILCQILIMETVLLVAQRNMYYDWNCKYPILDNAISALFRLAQMYRNKCLGNKDTDISFTDKDNDFINSVKIIHNKIHSVEL